MDIFTGSIDERKDAVNKLLNMESNFDIIQRDITIGGRQAVLFVINGFLNSDLCEKIIEYFYNISISNFPRDLQGFMKECLPFADTKPADTEESFKDAVLAGLACFMIDGYSEIITLDIRKFPSRSRRA